MVRLAAGEYRVGGQIRIRAGGIVLRGAGSAAGGTLLRATGTDQRPLILVDPGSGSPRKIAGSERKIIDKYVPVGATAFRLESAEGLVPGDSIIVFRPSTTEWIHDLGMDRIPGSGTVQWTAGSKDLKYERVITRLEGNRVFLDAPLCNSFEQRYGGGTVYKYEFPERIRNAGIERIAGISDYSGSTDENHSWDFIRIDRLQNGWVREVVATHFAYAAVNVGEYARNITVQDTSCLDPISQVTGGRRYSFNVDGSFNLVRDVDTRSGRHDFVQGSLTYGPNVFLHSRARNALEESGPHHRWSTGTLFDNVVVEGNRLAAWNRADSGTGHGWSGANIVFWNSEVKAFRVQNPFTAQNWVIGGIGTIEKPNDYLRGPLAIYDSHGVHVSLDDPGGNPYNSLYIAQLNQRAKNPTAQFREYLLGDYDNYTDDGAGSADEVYVDAGWRAEAQAFAASQSGSLARFDVAGAGQLVPFTFTFALDAREPLVAAALTIAVKRTGTASGSEAIWLGKMDDAHRIGFGSRGAQFDGDNAVAVIDLNVGWLSLLREGKLNVAVGGGLAVDWARLDVVAGGPFIAATVNAAGYQAAIAPSSWVTLFGWNLAGSTREWNQSDFTGTKLPASLDGVQVSINGKPAFVSFVSPAQVNVLAPDDEAKGQVALELSAPAGKAQATVQLQPHSPAFFAYAQAGGKYVVAVAADGFLARPGLIDGVATRPARPGEIISLYGTGFGATVPNLPAEELVPQPAPLATGATVRIGGVAATLTYQGKVGPGLYQFNLVVPEVPDGDQPVVSEIGGVQSPPGLAITIQRPKP